MLDMDSTDMFRMCRGRLTKDKRERVGWTTPVGAVVPRFQTFIEAMLRTVSVSVSRHSDFCQTMLRSPTLST